MAYKRRQYHIRFRGVGESLVRSVESRISLMSSSGALPTAIDITCFVTWPFMYSRAALNLSHEHLTDSSAAKQFMPRCGTFNYCSLRNC